jgi:hypothetical protein
MGGIAQVHKASPGTLVVLCEGKKGGGFWICTSCGAGFARQVTAGEHRTALGSTCRGRLENTAIGHEFLTDVLRVEFNTVGAAFGTAIDPAWFAWGLGYAFLLGSADVLEVPSQDLSVTITSDVGRHMPAIVLYDDVPGGAGLVGSLESPSKFRKALERAHERTSGSCGCGEDTSCYGCLRSYGNQFAHPWLSRGPVNGTLGTYLSAWATPADDEPSARVP